MKHYVVAQAGPYADDNDGPTLEGPYSEKDAVEIAGELSQMGYTDVMVLQLVGEVVANPQYKKVS